jgi:16S rRNA (guanine527-N7)-methyltransferase
LSRDPRLIAWLQSLLATPGLTAPQSFEEAWRLHVEDALTAVPYVEQGPVVDVGSGGGSPGIPIAASRPDLDVVLLDAAARKHRFLEEASAAFPNVQTICARAEDHGRDAGRDAYGTVVSRALAPQAVAAEWCLPLVRPGGTLVLFATEAAEGIERVADALGADPPVVRIIPGDRRRVLLVFSKREPTPARYPRRPGIARKRPLL